ncbi:hypothetical protein NU688_32805 [Variovorax sp. ZS18.2.2]|uniref:hypothetical protein n=1 Tax=Variovorax sp. ZS18.2.2 TaxID=2971255 RepID=UPI00215154F6|nr:hypothetical protein [Variovorax sp. ZS18.2.2]MCR6480977.1 hypothetical protein [Variovorax sp. ZS18.2.2]
MAEPEDDREVALRRERDEQHSQHKRQTLDDLDQQLLSDDEERELRLARQNQREDIATYDQAPGKTPSVLSSFFSIFKREDVPREPVLNEPHVRRGIPLWMLAALGAFGVGAVFLLWKGIDIYRQPPASIAMLAPGVAQSTASSPEEALAITEASRQAALDSSPLPNLEGAANAAMELSAGEPTSSNAVAAQPTTPTPTPSPAPATVSLGVSAAPTSSATAHETLLSANAQSDRLVELKALKDLQGRIAQLESQLEQLRSAPSAKPTAVVANMGATGPAPTSTAASAPVTPSAPTRTRSTRVSRATVAKATAPEPVLAVPPPMSGQLLSVDMWGGKPSVVLSSGLPGDKRVRVMQPGDAYNGIALKSVDPVSKTATFGYEGGRTFTLSISQGG